MSASSSFTPCLTDTHRLEWVERQRPSKDTPDVYYCSVEAEVLRRLCDMAAQSARSERAECSWNRVGGVYETSCGGDLAYEDTLQDCGVVYCQRCGGKVKDITNDE